MILRLYFMIFNGNIFVKYFDKIHAAERNTIYFFIVSNKSK